MKPIYVSYLFINDEIFERERLDALSIDETKSDIK